MPGDPKACREHAKCCYQIAAEAHSLEGKKHFEDLAQRWLELATDLDAAQALLKAWGEPMDEHEIVREKKARPPRLVA